jgi:hypothetical protein
MLASVHKGGACRPEGREAMQSYALIRYTALRLICGAVPEIAEILPFLLKRQLYAKI